MRLPWIWEKPQCSPLPDVRDESWPQTVWDHFVLAELEAAGLEPASQASREQWIRRAAFVLTGLPPAPVEVDTFVSDKAPEAIARERVVDRLLASPHFGERWARHWMDVMRYAESRGHESDFLIANAFHYRNYLIKAFNEDIGYDQFVREHLAGDLLENPRLDPVTGANDSVLATGWPFLGEEVHSPVDIRGDECDRVDNKIDVMSKAFLGLTVACARCHDHKFDAISQADYYSLAGFFLSSSYRQVRFESIERNRTVSENLWALRERSRSSLLKGLADQFEPGLAELGQKLHAALQGKSNEWSSVLDEAKTDSLHPLHRLHGNAGVSSETANQQVQRVLVDYSDRAEFWRPDGFAFGPRARRIGDLRFGAGVDPVTGIHVRPAAVFDPAWHVLETSEESEKDSGTIETSTYAGRILRTRTVTLESGKVHHLVRGKVRIYAGVDSHIMLAGPLHGGLVKKDGIRGNAGLRWVSHDLSAYAGHRVHFEFSPIKRGDSVEILKVVECEKAPMVPNVENRLVYEALETFRRTGSGAVLAGAVQGAFRTVIARLREGDLDDPSVASLADFMVRNRTLFSEESTPDVLAGFAGEQRRICDDIRARSRTAVSWLDGDGVEEYLLKRGRHQTPEGPCDRGLPVAINCAKPIRSADTSGRLELAGQLIDPENPLVARVIANRVWHHVFGRGIVGTTDNFGWLGERPTHPELLDRLAWDFVHKHGWSVKSLIRELVLSQSFGMASTPSNDPKVAEIDPENKLLHRMPLRRLEGEVLRDAILTVSGRLDRAMLGRPVPVHLTEFVVGRGRPSRSGPLDGEGRRSVYISVRRNFLSTLMLTFDTPTPFSTIGRRTVTNVPGQSLALMNDAFIHEQAGVWVERLLYEAPGGDSGRVETIFRQALGRAPSNSERSRCLSSLRQLRKETDSDAAAWKELCHTVFSLNEFLYVP